jgi:hypothetical protein
LSASGSAERKVLESTTPGEPTTMKRTPDFLNVSTMALVPSRYFVARSVVSAAYPPSFMP